MKTTKKVFLILLCLMFVGSISSIIFSKVKAVQDEEVVLRLAHGQAESSLVAKSVDKLTGKLEANKEMKMGLNIYPSGVLGSEKDMIELVKAGVLDMAKISATALGQFDDYYSIFALPYVFTGVDHYYNSMENSAAVKEIFNMDKDRGFMAIGWYASGARNIYTKDKNPVKSPADLKGKKLRVQESSTSMKMIEQMGGSPVPMTGSETYTALQQNVIDGAENTELALTVDKHGELVSSYTYTEHQYSPDIYIISTNAWNKLPKTQQDFLVKSLKDLNEDYKEVYKEMIKDATKDAEAMGVKFYTIDKAPFIEAVQPMHKAFKAKGGNYSKFYDDIQKYK
ncbi:TRAP transporter substrate-binding protein [Clostridium lacusfryxellense]|uniref:TRAP transporter substrate-binding protein n=1 Tax=Clostridium lacusfryxellense TaxID=205328 RepID=UPI001C0C904C|nr:TRAP transporter substrate-binding protein [Clostridium lacusfryxellense]MBU3114054.1 TRAP transporter substrate-binding protein [Clostridium lacusfryxellense]